MSGRKAKENRMMRNGSRISRWRGAAVFLALSAFLLLPLVGCSDSSTGGKKDEEAPQVSADPVSTIFTDSTIVVTLDATDNRNKPVTIYYTTDATTPTEMSSVYNGPLTIGETTVLKFFAVDAAGNASEVSAEGYTRALFSIEEDWAESGHGDILSEAFRHWDEDGEVSASCGACHAPEGFIDYIEDGTTDNPSPLPLGHYCEACHTAPPFTYYDELEDYPALEPVAFPSEVETSLWGSSNMCVICHQGRSSTVQVDAAIDANPGGSYTFINIHYYAAAASYFGTETKGGYEYEGHDYVGRNVFASHPVELQSCVGCHLRGDAADHTFLPQVGDCTSCHSGA
jgi:hypothetical protein